MSNFKDFDISALQASESGIDAFFRDDPPAVPHLPPRSASKKKGPRQKVASLDQLEGFIRTAADTLVHKSDRDLWSLHKDAQGDFYIERRFDLTGGPVKG